jgi:lipopolysaccharide/colanic/teichoic acid biosynthesis glycosyltransferase
MIKRSFDVILSLILVIILLPFYVLVSILILTKMGRPILFRQQRPGLSSEVFGIYKFRTMTNEKDKDGLPLSDVRRLSGLGRIIRVLSLDELPQIYNILKGEMSFVGPRPLLIEYLPLYSEKQSRRHEVRPGITGWAQVNGRNAISWDQKFYLDVWYVDNQSIWLDVKILWMTVKKVIMREGISQTNHVTMDKFKGSL